MVGDESSLAALLSLLQLCSSLSFMSACDDADDSLGLFFDTVEEQLTDEESSRKPKPTRSSSS